MCMQLSVTRRTTPVSQECTDRAISIVFSSNFTFGGITKGEGGNAWNLMERIVAPDYDVPFLPPPPLSCSDSGLRRTVLFTGENLSWKSASSSGERPYKNTHK
jgi:hypothetical protein